MIYRTLDLHRNACFEEDLDIKLGDGCCDVTADICFRAMCGPVRHMRPVSNSSIKIFLKRDFEVNALSLSCP